MSGALRETQEELGIDPAQVKVLGEIGPPETNLRASEVAAVIQLPLSALVSPTRIRNFFYRGQESYKVVDVTDMVQSTLRSSIRAETATNMAAEEINDELG